MKQEDIKEKVEDLVALVEAGKTMEAIDKYYHEDAVKWEAGQEYKGLPTIKKAMEEFESNITESREDRALNISVGSGVASITWKFDADHKQYGHMDFTEIAVQYWKEGKIVKEFFHYEM